MTCDNLRQELVLGREGISARLEKKTALWKKPETHTAIVINRLVPELFF